MERGELIAGRYELVSRLGRGGMGEVWATHDRRLRRGVALKLLVLDDDVVADLPMRFDREGVAAAQINHPNVVALYDRGVHGNVLFLVMEKVDGPALTEVIRQEGAMDLARALTIAGEICAALAAAHQAGIVHYDIKPHNVMLTVDGRVKVVDFGIAGFIQATFSLVRTSQLAPAGTPEYGAPEQFRTERGDERSDLYALGSVLFAMLTGRPPFTGHSGLAIMARKQDEDAPRLDTVRPEVPPALTTLVAELLDCDPVRRPRSAHEVHERLQQLRAALASGPAGTGVGERGRQTPVERAVRIARRIADPERQSATLVDIAGAVAGTAPDRAVQLLQHLPALECGVLLLGLAEEVADPERARQMVEEGTDLLTRLLPVDGLDALQQSVVAVTLARHNFQRAIPWCDRVEELLAEQGEISDLPLVEVAELASAIAETDPERAGRIMGRVEQLAHTLPPDPRSGMLVWIGEAGHAADRQCAERLIDLAEQQAMTVQRRDHRDSAMESIAVEVAGGNPRRAEEIIRKITENRRKYTWRRVLYRVSAAQPEDVLYLIDAAEKAALEPVEREVFHLGLFGRRRRVVTGPDPMSLREISGGIARFDALRAGNLAQQITDPHDRAEAFVEMAQNVAETDPQRARLWLATAYRAAIDADQKPLNISLVARIAGAAAAVHPELARQATQTAKTTSVQHESALGLAIAAEQFAAVDPEQAEQLVDHAARKEAPLGDTVQAKIAHTLIAVATALGSTEPERTSGLVRRIQQAAHAIRSDAVRSQLWGDSVTTLARRSPEAADQLVKLHHHTDRDLILKAIAPAFIPADLDRAEQIAEAITDEEARAAVFQSIAVLIARQPHTLE